MRTQEEILRMIRNIHESGVDPTMVQRKTLVCKLEWKNAEQFYPLAKRTEERKAKHEKMNSVDLAVLEDEVKEQVDYLFMLLAEGDVVRVHIHLQLILVYLWLMDKKTEALFRWLFKRLSWMNCNWREVGRHLATELGVSWMQLELRYPS